MKAAIRILIALAMLWSLWWFAAGITLRQGISGWFDAQAGRGWQAEFARIGTGGYPVHHITRLDSPALADPATGLAWRAEWIEFHSPAAWPGRQDVHFPPTPQRLSWFDRTDIITAQDMVARLHLHPGLSLELERMALSAGPWQVAQDKGDVARAESIALSMEQMPDRPDTYRLVFEAPGFAPGAEMRQLMRVTPSLPEQFEALRADAVIEFDRPWDRRALENRRPQPVEIDLKLAEARWGALQLMMAGKVTVDGGGVPTGTVSLKARNWREMLELARTATMLPEKVTDTIETTLDLVAGLTGNPADLDVQLNLRDGLIFLGPVPVGQAPRIGLR